MLQRHTVTSSAVSWGDHLTFGERDGQLRTPGAVASRLAVLARRTGCWLDSLADATHADPWALPEGAGADGTGSTGPAGSAGMTLTSFRASRVRWACAPIFMWRCSTKAGLLHRPASGRSAITTRGTVATLPGKATSAAVIPSTWWWTARDGRGSRESCRSLIPRCVPISASASLAPSRATEFDGLFVCLRSQLKPARFGDQYGFNKPACLEFKTRYGTDPRSEPFDLRAWRQHLGSYLTVFFRELRVALRVVGRRLAGGVPRGDVLGPPLSNAELQWRTWVAEGTLDELVVNQNSSRCPSMWHELWPMHRGIGYVQNYLNSSQMVTLRTQLAEDYSPVCQPSHTRLSVARQWKARSLAEEHSLLEQPVVAGLVFSSFRFDNPAAVARDD